MELIKNLRDRTGAGMMDCKRALEANNDDIEKACDWLREQGIAKSAKKASRIAAEGLTDVAYCEECGKAVVVEVNCETDFVAKGDLFRNLVSTTRKLVCEKAPATLDEALELTKELYTDATVSIGEKLSFRRFELVQKEEGQGVGTYIHMGGKISVLVLLEKEDAELAKGIAMHIAANNPSYICKNCVPATVIEHEKAIALEAAKTDEKLKNKPEQALAKIIEGKVNKTISETVLSEQHYLLDDSQTVGNLLTAKGNRVLKFVRYQVGEGIEKRKDDFASEVMSQI